MSHCEAQVRWAAHATRAAAPDIRTIRWLVRPSDAEGWAVWALDVDNSEVVFTTRVYGGLIEENSRVPVADPELWEAIAINCWREVRNREFGAHGMGMAGDDHKLIYLSHPTLMRVP